MDDFGTFFTTKHAQIVTGCPSFTMQTIFAAHIYAFFLKGVSSISKEGVDFNIMREPDKVSVCKEICPNHLFMTLYFQVYNWWPGPDHLIYTLQFKKLLTI